MSVLTVQDIVNSTSQDIRSVLGTSGSDATKITDWVDRVQKDCLHSSVYSYLNVGSVSFSTVINQSSYQLQPLGDLALSAISRTSNVVTGTTAIAHNLTVGESITISGVTGSVTSFNGTFTVATVPSTTTFTYTQTGSDESGTGGTLTASQPSYLIRRIVGCYDRTRERIIYAIERATNPVGQLEKSEPGPGQTPPTYAQPAQQPLQLQWSQAQFFRHLGFGKLVLFPTPKQIVSIEVAYELQVSDLSNLTDTLTIPSDGRDMIVAGTNYLANLFLKRAEEAQFWLGIYEKLKLGASLI